MTPLGAPIEIDVMLISDFLFKDLDHIHPLLSRTNDPFSLIIRNSMAS